MSACNYRIFGGGRLKKVKKVVKNMLKQLTRGGGMRYNGS